MQKIDSESRYLQESRERIMASNEGLITSVTFSLGEVHSLSAYIRAMLDFLSIKSKDEVFQANIVYSSDISRNIFESELSRNQEVFCPISYIQSQQATEHDIWIRDGAIRRTDGTIVISQDHAGDQYRRLAENENSQLEKSNLIFEAGDIRATASFVFIGFSTIYKNVERRKMNDLRYPITDKEINDVVFDFEQEFQREVVVVGLEYDQNGKYQAISSGQKVFHTDMIVTPIDDATVLVAQMEGEQDLERIANQLRSRFIVGRIPYSEFIESIGSKGQLSFNNVMIETRGNRRRVYLPQYYLGDRIFQNISAQYLDHLNKEALDAYWNSYDFEVIPIQISMDIAAQRAALNCIAFEKRIF